ncbi:hypothetical protein GR160_02020 [Flavobacterium sp. Sd200]|uniref:hypothetical protein n=1 Tax=Flavobacterium sp. Sd200 TaxID=2692211 RepID=UPI001367B553|nr:hypothetical protein [Flavobacterium sp. Sd200]MXN89989.1 hypothetical protein [Flavobacterium sp. Sd200]
MKKILLLAFLCVSTVGFAQKMKVTKGDFKFLSGQKELNVEFNYSELKLLKENLTEEEYINQRTEDLNKKTKGTGTTWAKKWAGSKEGIWNPKFMELLNKYYGAEKNVTVEEGLTSAKYTLIVDVVWIYPGWDAAVMKQPAKVSTVLRFVETANKSNVVLEIDSKEAPGDQWGSNFSNETRVGEGFAKTAKSLAKMIEKKVK